MKTIRWNEEKNRLLMEKRGVSFEEVLQAIRGKKLLAIEAHPNKEKYPGQKILVVLLDGYVHIVPYVETEEEIFLKTVYPDRKYHKKYAGGTAEEDAK